MGLTDTHAPGWRTPGNISPAASSSAPRRDDDLPTLDALIATYGMDGHELHDLMLLVRSLYRGGGVTHRQALFLHDVSRSLDDLAIDASP